MADILMASDTEQPESQGSNTDAEEDVLLASDAEEDQREPCAELPELGAVRGIFDYTSRKPSAIPAEPLSQKPSQVRAHGTRDADELGGTKVGGEGRLGEVERKKRIR